MTFSPAQLNSIQLERGKKRNKSGLIRLVAVVFLLDRFLIYIHTKLLNTHTHSLSLFTSFQPVGRRRLCRLPLGKGRLASNLLTNGLARVISGSFGIHRTGVLEVVLRQK